MANMLKKFLLALVVLIVVVGAGVPGWFYLRYPKMRPAPEM
jgi:hypothetical protein